MNPKRQGEIALMIVRGLIINHQKGLPLVAMLGQIKDAFKWCPVSPEEAIEFIRETFDNEKATDVFANHL